jgi:hypothetical protein
MHLDTISNVKVESTSFIDIRIRKLDVELRIRDENGNPIKNFVGFGTVNDQQFPSRQTTTFSLPLSIYYRSILNNNIRNDPAIKILTDNCVLNGKNKLDALVSLKFELSSISWAGIRPRVTLDKTINCPDITSLNKIIGELIPT